MIYFHVMTFLTLTQTGTVTVTSLRHFQINVALRMSVCVSVSPYITTLVFINVNYFDGNYTGNIR